MQRALLVALALLLPLQLSWAGAAAYCQHETAPLATAHFGHHGHQHTASTDEAKPAKFALDNDCGTCHAFGAQAPWGDQVVLLRPERQQHPEPFAVAAPASAHRDAPDRPNWRDLA